MPRLALLAAALAWGAGGPRAEQGLSEGAARRLERQKAEAISLMRELEELSARSSGCPERYLRSGGAEGVREECRTQSIRLHEKLSALALAIEDMSDTRKSVTVLLFDAAALGHAARGAIDKDRSFLPALSAASEFEPKARSSLQALREQTRLEDLAWVSAVRELESRRRRRLLAWSGASGLLLLAGLAAAWRRRPRDRPLVPGPPARRAAGPETLGRLLRGTYRLDHELGRGGMGVVFEATDMGLNRKVAVKRVSLETEGSPESRALLLREAQTVATLSHPNILRIYDIFEEGGRLYLVLEHLPGKTLREALSESGSLPLAWIKATLRQVGSALDYAHARGVVHRDLKPSNIMAGPDGAVKVMDFGLARRWDADTRTQGRGTPPYMAPEAELGDVSPAADIFSLGVCLYELATGGLPFTGPDFLGQKQRMQYLAASVLNPGLPRGLDPILARALASDPSGRFHSAAELTTTLLALP